MRMIIAIVMVLAWTLSATGAFAQNPVYVLDQNAATTVTNLHSQKLRDPSNPDSRNAVKDPLATEAGDVAPVVVGVGGLVGFGEIDMPIPRRVREPETVGGPSHND